MEEQKWNNYVKKKVCYKDSYKDTKKNMKTKKDRYQTGIKRPFPAGVNR